MARFGHRRAPVNNVDDADIRSVRIALRCLVLRELFRRTSGPTSRGDLAGNIFAARRLTSRRVPPDPTAAAVVPGAPTK